MAAKHITLIHNPDAGDSRQPTAGQLVALLKEAGYKEVRCQSAKEPGWEKALKRSVDIVAVAGGDGTVTKVARRLIGKDLPIAVLPLGTANNISKALGISGMPVTQLIPLWQSARRVAFDAGIARGPWGERYFIEGAGVGLLTSSMPKVSASKTLEHLKEAEVKVAYAQQLFRDHLVDAPAKEIKATLDGDDISGRYLLLEVMNFQYIGPNLYLAPDLVRNDGEFDVILVSEQHREKLRHHIKRWQDGKLLPPEFVTRRGKRLEIRWTGFPLHIDDKVWPFKGEKKPRARANIEFEVEPEAVRFLVPAEVFEMQELARKNREKGKRLEGKKLARRRAPAKSAARGAPARV